METWIQSLSWTLIYALGQGFLVYASLRLIFKLTPASASFRYHLSLAALSVLLIWFGTTWWHQYHALVLSTERLHAAIRQGTTVIGLPPATQAGYMGHLQGFLVSLKVIFPWLSGCYITGLVLMLARLSAGMLQLFSLKKNGTELPDAALSELLATLKERMRHNPSVRLLLSARAHVPMVIGFLKPVILLPMATIAQLSTDQVETILLHELAHLKRHDYLINILQTIVETILFFNPFVWLISSITRREREYSCDDMVLQYAQEPISYATALAALAAPGKNYSGVVIAATGKPTYLFNRIKRIMEMEKTSFSYSRTAAAVLIITLVACSTAWLTPGFAKSAKDKAGVKADVQKTPPSNDVININQPEERRLVDRLMGDGLVDQVKGFVVEKRQNVLIINGKQQPEEIAKKYLSSITKENIRVEVFSFIERLNRHPDGSFIQILFPVSNSSPCVDYKTSKPEKC